MGQQTNIRSHFVPQCLLERFVNETGKLHVFDKFATHNSYETGPKNIAVERAFYELPPSMVAAAKKIDPNFRLDIQFVEKRLAQIETGFDAMLDLLLIDAELGKPNLDEQKNDFAKYLAIQMLRTKESRQRMQKGLEQAWHTITREFLKREFPQHGDVPFTLEFDEFYWRIYQIEVILDEERIDRLASELEKHVWVIGKNSTIQPLYTSDNPVTKKANLFAPDRNFTGVKSPGIEIIFSFSPKYALILLERRFFANVARHHNTIVPQNPSNVERINIQQVKSSFRQVYCSRPEFEQAKWVCKKYPEVCIPDRDRGSVKGEGDVMVIRGTE